MENKQKPNVSFLLKKAFGKYFQLTILLKYETQPYLHIKFVFIRNLNRFHVNRPWAKKKCSLYCAWGVFEKSAVGCSIKSMRQTFKTEMFINQSKAFMWKYCMAKSTFWTHTLGKYHWGVCMGTRITSLIWGHNLHVIEIKLFTSTVKNKDRDIEEIK